MEVFAVILVCVVMLLRLALRRGGHSLALAPSTVPDPRRISAHGFHKRRADDARERKRARSYAATAKELVDGYFDRHTAALVDVLRDYRDAKQIGASVFHSRPAPDRAFWWLGSAYPTDVSKVFAIVAVSAGRANEASGSARLYPATISINPQIPEAEKLSMKLVAAAGSAFSPVRHGPGYTRVDMPGFPVREGKAVRVA